MDKELNHYGTPRHSGRYPWGSGEDPEQRNKSFLGYVDDLKKKGVSEVDIAKGLNITTTQLRAKKSIAKDEQRKVQVAQALRLKDKGYSNVAIGERMGLNESSVRALLNPSIHERTEITRVIANMLKESVDKHKYIDVGVGTEYYMGISRTKLKTSLSLLEEEGYKIHKFDVEQLGTGKKTNLMVLTKDDVTYGEVRKNKGQIEMVVDHSPDGGRTFTPPAPIESINSNRIMIRYGDQGGSNKDGLIEIRRGVDDLSLGKSKYAQVRIGVDGTHYLKGMAMYNDNMSKDVDIIYNSNKKSGTPKEKVFKEMNKDKDGNIDMDNPFGATIKAGGQRRALNIVNEEGDWQEKWSKSLSSQMLSKQLPTLASKQLKLAYLSKKEEFDEINALTNPVVKKKLLDSFSDDCDSSAVHLKAAALPREGWHVLLPFPNMKENEIYAPNYRDGEKVVIIRYPHGGIFEIPELTVNNRNPEAKKSLGRAKDAVGIHPKVAEKLSGADFDGDTGLVIPNTNKQIKTSLPLEGLKDFDPKTSYKPYHGMVTIDGGVYNEKTGKADFQGRSPSSKTKQLKMGDVSNLITDMTIKGANTDEIARAVRHSMVVIDAEKHHLDYKRSYIENNIGALKLRYQGSPRSGASTLISRASSEKRVDYREDGQKMIAPSGKKKRMYVDPDTGKKLYNYTGESYTKTVKGKNGSIKNVQIKRQIKSTKMEETDDAFTLSSGTYMESVYASHANRLKALANEARKQSLNTPRMTLSPSAKQTYAKEVASLKAQLNIALKNAPLERKAQLLATVKVEVKKEANPGMDADDLKKLKGQVLAEARSIAGANKQRIIISDREWEAIQSGAISTNILSQILNNTDLDRIKTLATPKTKPALSPIKEQRIKLMLSSGHTQSEIADSLGVSIDTVSKFINE